MKITIDTKQDSEDEIEKVIRLLSSMIRLQKNKDIFTTGPTDPSPEQESEESPETGAFMNMFGGDEPTEPVQEEEKTEEEAEETE